MNILIVKAHPRSNGFTHEIAETYKQRQEWLGNTVEIIDIYAANYIQWYPIFAEDGKHFMVDEKVQKIQEIILWADEIVFVFPVWWFDWPGALKNWFDINMTAGFAYKYQKWWKIDKLLQWKNAKIFATSDGPSWLIKVFVWLPMIIGRINFVGLKLKAFKILGDFRKRSTEEKERFLDKL